MDAELVALTSTGAATIVSLLATDAWSKAKTAIGSLWHRVSPDQGEAVEADLVAAHDALMAAQEAGNEGEVIETLIGDWQHRLSLLLAADPGLAIELRHALDDELVPALAGIATTAAPTMHASASGEARIYQAGRDMHITER